LCCQHHKDICDMIYYGFIVHQYAALLAGTEEDHGPSQLNELAVQFFCFPPIHTSAVHPTYVRT
jgi:hypothetical protein